MVQLTSKMAIWSISSQLLLIALLGCIVHCIPTRKVWRQQRPYRGNPYNTGVRRGSSPQTSHPSPYDLSNPTVSYMYVPVEDAPGETQQQHQDYPETPTADRFSADSWWHPGGGSAARVTPEVVKPAPHLPPPPSYPSQPDYQQSQYQPEELEHGNTGPATDQQDLPASRLSFFSPYQFTVPSFQPGELSNYQTVFEHGGMQSETEHHGYRPPPPLYIPGYSTGRTSLLADGPNPGALSQQYHLFTTGRHPPGTLSNFKTGYEEGSDGWHVSQFDKYKNQNNQGLDDFGRSPYHLRHFT